MAVGSVPVSIHSTESSQNWPFHHPDSLRLTSAPTPGSQRTSSQGPVVMASAFIGSFEPS